MSHANYIELIAKLQSVILEAYSVRVQYGYPFIKRVPIEKDKYLK